MHELPITQNILEIGLKHARLANAQRINQYNIVIGQFASVVDDSIRFYWELIAKDTIAEKAFLNFKRLPAQFKCLDCQADFTWDGESTACPQCCSKIIKLTSGNEFFIESIDIE